MDEDLEEVLHSMWAAEPGWLQSPEYIPFDQVDELFFSTLEPGMQASVIWLSNERARDSTYRPAEINKHRVEFHVSPATPQAILSGIEWSKEEEWELRE